jgi:hypothetical protein
MSTKRGKRISTTTLKRWLIRLLPMVEESQVELTIADLGRSPTSPAGYARSWSRRGDPPARSLILLDEEIVRRGGWRRTLETAIHEYAHVIRNHWDSAIDPDDMRYLASHAEESLQAIMLADFLSGVEFGESDGWEHAFGAWVNGDGCRNAGHDSFFIFIHYMLARRAHDLGMLSEEYVLVKSAARSKVVNAAEIEELVAAARRRA